MGVESVGKFQISFHTVMLHKMKTAEASTLQALCKPNFVLQRLCCRAIYRLVLSNRRVSIYGDQTAITERDFHFAAVFFAGLYFRLVYFAPCFHL